MSDTSTSTPSTTAASFDQAQEDFRAFKTERYATTYLIWAATYFADGKIGKATFHAAINEVMAWRNVKGGKE